MSRNEYATVHESVDFAQTSAHTLQTGNAAVLANGGRIGTRIHAVISSRECKHPCRPHRFFFDISMHICRQCGGVMQTSWAYSVQTKQARTKTGERFLPQMPANEWISQRLSLAAKAWGGRSNNNKHRWRPYIYKNEHQTEDPHTLVKIFWFFQYKLGMWIFKMMCLWYPRWLSSHWRALCLSIGPATLHIFVDFHLSLVNSFTDLAVLTRTGLISDIFRRNLAWTS